MARNRGVSMVGPLILIGLGLVFLLSNLGVLPENVWDYIWRLWPILLIAIGLDIVIGRRSVWGSLAVLVLILALLGVIFFATNLSDAGNWFPSFGRIGVSATFDKTLEVEGPVSLSADVPVGSVEVKVGSAQTVRVEATRWAWGGSRSQAEEILGQVGVDVQQTGNRVQVLATGLTGRNIQGRSPKVDIKITVPAGTSVDISSRVGEVSVTGTQGDLAISADVGEVKVRKVSPAKSLRINSRVGSVEFSGALMPRVDYEITTDVGKISLELPRDSAFILDARSDIGDVRLDFELVGTSGRRTVVGRQVEGQVGASPTTHLTLLSRIGEIRIDSD